MQIFLLDYEVGEIKSKHYSYVIPFLNQICFLYEPLGFKFPKSFSGLAAVVQIYLWPLPGTRAVVWPPSASSRKVPTQFSSPSEIQECYLHSFLTCMLWNRHRDSTGSCFRSWNWPGLVGATENQSAHSKWFHKPSLHLWSYLHILPYLIPNHQFLPGKGVRRYKNVPPSIQNNRAIFSHSQTSLLWCHQNDKCGSVLRAWVAGSEGGWNICRMSLLPRKPVGWRSAKSLHVGNKEKQPQGWG